MAKAGDSDGATGSKSRSGRVDARTAILDATIKVLETSGEAAVRLASVAEDAGVAIGLIGYHFGGREGLIETAQAERYSERSVADLSALEAGIAAAKDPDDFLGLLAALTSQAVAQASREGSRMRRVALLGSAFGRPDLLAHYGEVQRNLTDQYEQAARTAQDNGLLRPDLDPRAVAVFTQAYALGMVLADIDPDGPDAEAMSQVILAAMSSLIPTTDPG